jgi:hypothetical protein
MALPTLVLLESSSATTNPAIAKCREAWLHRFEAGISRKEGNVLAAYYADAAYREAMPPLIDHDSIRDFIACAADGMLVDTIDFQNGTQLLYAAQVAMSTLNRKPRETMPPGRPKKITK